MIMEFTHMGYLSMSASIDETIHSKGCKTSTGPQLFTSIMALICKNYLWCPLGRYQRILPTIKSTQALLILPMEGLFVTGYKLFILSNVEDNDIKKKKIWIRATLNPEPAFRFAINALQHSANMNAPHGWDEQSFERCKIWSCDP